MLLAKRKTEWFALFLSLEKHTGHFEIAFELKYFDMTILN